MKTPNTITDYQMSLDILHKQRQIRRERFFSGPGLIMGLTVFILIVIAAIIIPVVANVDPNATAIADRLKGPGLRHPFGISEFGHDSVIRVLYGARASLLAGNTVALLSCALGTVIGIYTSYLKILDHILMRIYKGLMAIPGMLLTVVFIAALGANNLSVIIAPTTVYTPNVVRIVRSSALITKEQPYVRAAKIRGVSNEHILRRLILSGVVSPLTVRALFIFAQAIISEASLNFLGAGIPAPAANWGSMLQGSEQVLQKALWIVIFLGLTVVFCMLSLNLLGDELRDYPDPRTAGRKK